MKEKPHILLTGASGFLGWHIAQLPPSKYTFTGTYFRQNYPTTHLKWERINLMETKDLQKWVAQQQADLIIHTAAIANTSFCEKHPAMSHHINVYSTLELAKAAKALDIPLIFTSTDMVFNGNSAPYDEYDFPYPLLQYGMQKAAAEEALFEDFEKTIVCRLPLLYGLGPNYSKTFFSNWLQALQEEEQVHAFIDEYRTPLSARNAAEWLLAVADYALSDTVKWEEKERLLHLGGNERLSRYEFAIKMASIFQLPTTHIISLKQEDADLKTPRPKDTSLSNKLAKDITYYSPKTIEEELQHIKMQIT